MNSYPEKALHSFKKHECREAERCHHNKHQAFLKCFHPTAGHFEDTPVGVTNADTAKKWLLNQDYDVTFIMDCTFEIIYT